MDFYAKIDADPVGEAKKLLRDGDSFGSLHEDKAVRGLLRRIEELVRMVADATLQRDQARAEVERLTSERDVERDMRIERACLLVAERLRFTVAYDAVQQMHRERAAARAEVERLTKERGQMVETIRTARQALKNGSHDAAFAILDSSLDAEPEPAP